MRIMQYLNIYIWFIERVSITHGKSLFIINNNLTADQNKLPLLDIKQINASEQRFLGLDTEHVIGNIYVYV